MTRFGEIIFYFLLGIMSVIFRPRNNERSKKQLQIPDEIIDSYGNWICGDCHYSFEYSHPMTHCPQCNSTFIVPKTVYD
jgi:rubrerythrin